MCWDVSGNNWYCQFNSSECSIDGNEISERVSVAIMEPLTHCRSNSNDLDPNWPPFGKYSLIEMLSPDRKILAKDDIFCLIFSYDILQNERWLRAKQRKTRSLYVMAWQLEIVIGESVTCFLCRWLGLLLGMKMSRTWSNMLCSTRSPGSRSGPILELYTI